jgi:hypothetical protein
MHLCLFINLMSLYPTDRVVWYGGESTQLHYEQQSRWMRMVIPTGLSVSVRTLGGGVPTGVSEMHTCCRTSMTIAKHVSLIKYMAMVD